MSTSDPQEHGPLTRKQLREIRLTGSTPVISAEQAAEAAAAAAAQPATPSPRPAEPVAFTPEPRRDADSSSHSLTRRQIREQERMNTASMAVVGASDADAQEEPPVDDTTVADADEKPAEDIVSEVPDFSDDDDADDDEQVDIAPVSAADGCRADAETASDDADAATEEPTDVEATKKKKSARRSATSSARACSPMRSRCRLPRRRLTNCCRLRALGARSTRHPIL